MYGYTLLKPYNFLYKGYGQKYISIPICNFFIKFGYYYNYYIVILKNKFELSLEDI
jgi:hypothetical protein